MIRTAIRGAVLSLVVVAALIPTDLFAQSERAEGAVFLRPRLGISYYLGDNEKSPFNFDGEMFDNSFPYSVGAELGYQFNPRYSLGLRRPVAARPQ